MKLPSELGPIHFIGIGGIGMSGIAEVLITQGYKVQGSDAAENANAKRLRELGAQVFVGHKAEQIAEAAVVVVSSATWLTSDQAKLRDQPKGPTPRKTRPRPCSLETSTWPQMDRMAMVPKTIVPRRKGMPKSDRNRLNCPLAI